MLYKFKSFPVSINTVYALLRVLIFILNFFIKEAILFKISKKLLLFRSKNQISLWKCLLEGEKHQKVTFVSRVIFSQIGPHLWNSGTFLKVILNTICYYHIIFYNRINNNIFSYVYITLIWFDYLMN